DGLLQLPGLLPHAAGDPVVGPQAVDHGAANAGNGVRFKLHAAFGIELLHRVHKAKNAVTDQIVGIDAGRQANGDAPRHILDQRRVVDDQALAGLLAAVRPVLRPELFDVRPARLHLRQSFLPKLDLAFHGIADDGVPVPPGDLRKSNGQSPETVRPLLRLVHPLHHALGGNAAVREGQDEFHGLTDGETLPRHQQAASAAYVTGLPDHPRRVFLARRADLYCQHGRDAEKLSRLDALPRLRLLQIDETQLTWKIG